MAFTPNDDLNIIQASDSAAVSAGAGNDTYILSPATIGADQEVTITDTDGLNTLQLVGGLSIVSSQVANDALQLTLSNGAVVTLLSASAFNFNVGGNVLAGIAGTDKTYAAFAQEDLGVTVPAEGEAAVDGGAATIGEETPTEPTEPTLTLTAGSDAVNEGDTASFTLAGAEANTEYAYQVTGAGATNTTAVVTTDANGSATITVPVSDVLITDQPITVSIVGQSLSSSITAVAVDDAPELTGTVATLVDGTEDEAYTVSEADLLEGFTDEEGATLAVANLTADNGATVADNGDGTYTITPADNFNGTVSLSYDVTDGANVTAATQSVEFAAVNDAPTTTDAAATATEAGDVVVGQLEAADVDAGDTLTFALDAPVEGLTVNADGSWTFDPSQNTAAQALTYTDADLPIVANYTVTDSEGATDSKSLTITVTPTPLTFELVSNTQFVEEGSEIEYTIVASEAIQDAAITGTVQILPGDGTTGQTSAADFGSGSFNPQTVTIAVGETVSTVATITPTNDAAAELPESYTASATVEGFEIADLAGEVRDPSSVGGLGQTFTLTTGVDTIPGLVGSAGTTGTDGDDTIIGNVNATGTATTTNNSTISALDNIDGGAGEDTFKVQVISTAPGQVGPPAVPAITTQNVLDQLTLTNVENMVIESAVALTADVSAFTSVTDVNVANITTGATAVTAAATQDVTLSDTAVDAAVGIIGGKDVDVTLTNTTGAANAITLGAGTAVSGTVDVSSTADAITGGTGATAMGAITTTGGTTVNIAQDANSVSGNAATAAIATDIVTTGTVTVTGGNNTTTVNIDNGDQVAAVAARAATAAVAQTQNITFTALTAGQSVSVNGLTFTASVALTAEQVAKAFENLTATDRQDDGGPTANGFYTGQMAGGFTTGAANGAIVTFTEVTAGTNQAIAVAGAGVANVPAAAAANTVQYSAGVAAPTVAAGTNGIAGVTAVTGVAGVTNGAVVVDDNATKSITDITVDGYAGNATLGATAGTSSLDALQNLTLKNSGAGVAALTTASTGALNLTLDDVDANVNLDVGGASLTSLTVNTEGTASTGSIIAAAATNVTINAEANLTAGAATDFTAATTVDINGSAAVNLANNGFANNTTLQTINAADNTGGMTVTLGTGNRVAVTGGTGNDTVNLAQTTIATGDSIALGAGNDTLNFTGAIDAANIAAGVTLSGGAGDADVIGLTSARATTETADAAFEAFIDGFEILSIGQTAANTQDTANLANMDDISHVRYANADTSVKAAITFGAGSTAAVTTNDTISFVSNGVTYTATIGTTAGASATVAEIQTAVDTAVGVAGQVIVSDAAGVLTLTALGNDTLVSNGVTAGTHGFVDADGAADNAGTASAITAGTASETISNMANNGTLELQRSGLGATVQMTDSTGSADSLNIILDDSLDANGFNAGTVTTSASAAAIVANNLSGVETVNLTVDDTVQDANNDGRDDTNATYFLTFAEQTATATKLDIGGAGDLNLTTAAFAANAPLVTVDASDMTGALTYTANNANMTVTGGSGNDQITVSATADSGTFNGGAGNDTFVIAGGADTITLNGGAGTDTFDVNGVSTTNSNYAVIQDASAGDIIDLAGLAVNAFNATAVTLSAGATQSTQAYQEAAMNALATNAAGWFQYDNGNGVNTFIVADLDGNASYDAAVDFTIMLVGAVDLSTASFNNTSSTIEIA